MPNRSGSSESGSSQSRHRLPPALWFDTVDLPPPRSPLPGPTDVDVAIVGGGFTGLWTAYYLAALMPSASIAVVEANRAGFGASGRNGGWCISELAAGPERWDALDGPGAGARMDAAIRATVDEIRSVGEAERIDCDFAMGGELYLARNHAQVDRLRAESRPGASWLGPSEATELCNATEVLGGLFAPHTAVLHPGKLVFGLADAVARRGVSIWEDTAVSAIEPGRVITSRGNVAARSIVVATEAYTRDLAGHRRDLVPLYSLMVATEPLPPEVLAEIRLETRPAFADARYRVIYGQRTADGRIAFGGRSAPYRMGSAIDPATELSPAGHRMIVDTLHELFPVLRGHEITHRWGGVLGVPRNWTPSVSDLGRGIYRAGGYVGEGVAASNLAGRCVAHLIAAAGGATADDELTTLPWVRAPSRRWPIEPFRYLGIRAGAELFEWSDRRESRRGRTAREAELVWKYLRR